MGEYIDIHPLMSALLPGIPLWTVDKKLHEFATSLLLSH
jgi:hypothetical protein